MALDDEAFLLPKLFLKPSFEIRQKPSCFLLVRRNHTIDDNFIAIGEPAIVQKPALGCGKKVRPPN